jgi:hypothetical protein
LLVINLLDYKFNNSLFKINKYIMNWKWSNGETYYKSPRTINVSKKDSNINISQNIYDSASNAINLSLYDDINNIYTNNDNNNYDKINSTSKREEIDDKLSNRDLVFQRGTNPFMNQTSYVDDVITRDMFLKPVNTTHGKIVEENKNENIS